MQLLCIETVVLSEEVKVIKNEIYHPCNCFSLGISVNGLDKWYTLKELRPTVQAHASLFIELPDPDPEEVTEDVEYELVENG